MFEDSLIESGGRLKTKRGVWTFFSFILEAVLVGVLVLIPLLFTEALPKTQLMTFLVAPPRHRHLRHRPRGSGQDCQASADRYRQRATAHAHQDSRESTDDQGR